MHITKLEVKGTGKESAIITLKKGLNVISGASDTGKSYITDCLSFILGAKEPPKAIEESQGYTHLEVTFSSKKGQFILTRELKQEADITLTESYNNNVNTALKPTHKGKNNLSSFFLSQFNLNDIVLAKGLGNFTSVSLTLRVLEKIFLVDEQRIISKNSPLGTGQNTETTQETSLLKTLLTGNDDAGIKESKQNKHSKENLTKKITNLEDFIKQFFPIEDDTDAQFEVLNQSLDELEATYEKAENELNELIHENGSLLKERQILISDVNELVQKKNEDNLLVSRFRKLLTKYQSDRERLVASSEATKYMGKLNIVNCPTCGSEISEKNEVNHEAIIESNQIEIYKIDMHIQDLNSTISSIENSFNSVNSLIDEKNSLIEELDYKLKQELGSKIQENRKILSSLDTARKEFRQKRNEIFKRKEMLTELGRLQTQKDDIDDKYEIEDFSSELKLLSNEISSILERWGLPNYEKSYFDIETKDLIIGTKKRSAFGKGYRAIYFASIILGLMEYLFPKNRHPGFIVLDSPLTTYSPKDSSSEESEDESLAKDIIYSFYHDLCDSYKDKQVIILENQEPDSRIHKLMKYIHFSGNKDVGRAGFFPI